MMRNTILLGDILDLLNRLASRLVNCIITSPPYFGLRNYDLPPTNWPEVTYSPMAGLPPLTIPAMTCCFGLEDTIEAYIGHLVLIWRGLWRVLREDGVCWLNLGDSYCGYKGDNYGVNPENLNLQKNSKVPISHNIGSPHTLAVKPKDLMGIPWRAALALQADGWWLRSDCIWNKKNPMPESVGDRPTKAHEYVFLLTKAKRYWYDQEAIREENSPTGMPYGASNRTKGLSVEVGSTSVLRASSYEDRIKYATNGRNVRTVWTIATRPFKGAHFAVMPPELAERCLLAGCPSRVCVECGEPWERVVEKEKGDTESSNPTCSCAAPHQPGLVFDPFFGAGTVGVVAKKAGRHWLGADLNPEYVEMANRRLDRTQPVLFPVE